MKIQFCIAYKNDDGGTSILIPASATFDIEKLAETNIPKMEDGTARPYRIVDVNKIPKDRYFRNAWTDDFKTDTVDVDPVKAVEIQMGHIRKLRDEKLKNLDVDYMIALEADNNTKKASIKKDKQHLRDLPATVDLFRHGNDLEALKADFGGLDN